MIRKMPLPYVIGGVMTPPYNEKIQETNLCLNYMKNLF